MDKVPSAYTSDVLFDDVEQALAELGDALKSAADAGHTGRFGAMAAERDQIRIAVDRLQANHRTNT